MSDSGPAWLCYGDYVCLSTCAGSNQKERKYILGHSSPLMQLRKVQNSKNSNSDFASIILAENPATIAFTHLDSGKGNVLDMVTNARDYWFEILPRTDYDMSAQLSVFKKQLGDAKRRLQQLVEKQSQNAKSQAAQQFDIADKNLSTLDVALNAGTGIHLSSQPVGDEATVTLEMQPLGTIAAAAPSAFQNRRKSLSSSRVQDDQDIANQKIEIDNLENKVAEYKTKMLQEQKGNVETINRTHGDALVFGALIQLRHLSSRRLMTISKQVDRPVELAQYGRSGSLFYIERMSTGVAGGSTKVPCDENISIRLRSFVSDSQFLRMEPNLALIPGTKFQVSLDVELDGVFNADSCFQLGTGAATPGDNRVEWIIERCKHNSNSLDGSSETSTDGDDAEDDDVDVSEVLSGCQIIRLFHRASESYICAVPTKVDRGKVFFSHRSESDPSQGLGKIANSYWMIIDGDGDMADSGEDVNTDSPVILQHVISGMVLVGIRHLPAIDSNRATYDEEYLSDEDDSTTADSQAEEKFIITHRNKLDAWIQTFLTSIDEVVEYCSKAITSDFTINKFLAENDISDSFYEQLQYQRQPVDAEEDEFGDAAQGGSRDEKRIRVEQWKDSSGAVKTILKETEALLVKVNDLTRQSINEKASEIEHEVEAWFRSPVYRSLSGRRFSAIEVVDWILAKVASTDDDFAESGSQSGRQSVSSFSSKPTDRHTVVHSQSQLLASTIVSQSNRNGSAAQSTQLDDSKSQILRDTKSSVNPLHKLESLIQKFKKRDQKQKKSDELDKTWTFHIMTPKRILKFRKSFPFSGITLEKKEPFLISCRWSLSTKHEKVRRKEGEMSITNTTLFGLEVFDVKNDQVFLIGNQQTNSDSVKDSSNSGTKRQKDLAIMPLGRLVSGQGLEPQIVSKMESQLFNVEFVSLKSADQIRNGSQVSSIIRNFCCQLSVAAEKRDVDTYVAFLRRYYSRLTEAFDVVARSCVVDGFQKDCNFETAEVDRQGQLFFGSLGIIELAFSVIQPLTEQLGWQLEEEPPFFTHWNVRFHWAPVLHCTLAAISATTSTVTQSKADEFFKLWRQRRDDAGKPFSDDQMLYFSEFDQHEKLQEMGFPPLLGEKGQITPKVAHNLFRFFALAKKIKSQGSVEWHGVYPDFGNQSPKQYVESLMEQNFPDLVEGSGFSKKVRDVERFFQQAFTPVVDDGETVDQDDGAYQKNDDLYDVLEYGMKPSDLDYFCNKYIKDAKLVVFKAMISPALASRIRKIISKDESHSSMVEVPVGQQTFYLSEAEFLEHFQENQGNQILNEVKDPNGNSPIMPPWLTSTPSPPPFKKEIQLKREMLKCKAVSNGFEHSVSSMYVASQKNLAKILKNVALDVDNFDSPWNSIPITFNFKDPVRFGEIRLILIDIIKKSLSCLMLLCKYCGKNQKRMTSPQIYYLIKNLFPKSAQYSLNIGSVLKFTLQGNFSVIDRMYTDAVYSSLLVIMNDLRSPGVPQVLESLMVNLDGMPDYGQQMRVLKYAFKIPYSKNQILIPRVSVVRKNGAIDSLSLVFDSTFALNKQKSKPTPRDHPFAYIKPPPWAKSADGERRLFVEPWDVFVPVTSRTGYLGERYGEWCPSNSFDLKLLAQEHDVLEDFGYFTSLKQIEKQWDVVHKDKSLDRKALEDIECDLKRDWWYCTMLLHLQYICSCYSLVAKLCSNRNIQAWNFFFDKQKQTKNDFFVQTWGSRPQKSIITHEGDLIDESATHNSNVKFDIDSFSTVAAVSNIKPMNPSCAYEIEFPDRRFMYYEVSIESEPDDKSMLQIGWTIASRERNADHVSDGEGTGDFPHSWGVDGIRKISYSAAEDLLQNYNTTIEEEHIKLSNLVSAAKDLLGVQIRDIYEKSRTHIDFEAISRVFYDQAESMQKCGQDETHTSKIKESFEISKLLLRSRISLRRNVIAQMNAAKQRYDQMQNKPSFEEWKKNANVERGVLCFHNNDSYLPDSTVAYMSNEIEAKLNSTNPPSFLWSQKCIIGVWFDMDSMESGIVRSEEMGGKQVLFRRSETAFFEDISGLQWKESDIVPCISGKGVEIKINLGILEGRSNHFTFFDEEKLVFKGTSAPSVAVSSVKNGKFCTHADHKFTNNQFVRLKFPPVLSYEVEPSLKDGIYTLKDHGLTQNQFVHFKEQVSFNEIDAGNSYIVQLMDKNPDQFRLLKCNLKENEPYRVRFDISNPNIFELCPTSLPDAVYCSDPILHPRVFLTGKVSRAFWGPYGERPVDVTQIYNDLYEQGLREFGTVEAIYADGTIKSLSAGLKDLFQPKDTQGKILFEGQTCCLKVFPSIVIFDTEHLNIQFITCTGFAPPTRVSSAEIANFAFADGKPVIPDYHLLSDIVFCSTLPPSLRSSCVELLRSCFIDQEPWFLTPPINTIRAIQEHGRIAPSAVKNPGAYLTIKMKEFQYRPQKTSKEFGEDYCGYDESDVALFVDLFNAAAWVQSQSKDPVNFGNKNWDDDTIPERHKSRKEFLLSGFKYPLGPFQLCTRDIAIFWGRVSCLLWEKDLKDRFISKKNQDCKSFLKNVVYCLLDTLKFEFDESWIGIIAVRSKVVKDLEESILSYFKQTEIAQMVADVVKKRVEESSSNSSVVSNDTSRLSKFLSFFRPQNSPIGGRNSNDASHVASHVLIQYTSRVPKAIRQSVLFINHSLLREFAQRDPESRQNWATTKYAWMSKSTKLLTAPSEVLLKEANMMERYMQYSVDHGNSRGEQSGPYGYFEWPILTVESVIHESGQLSHDELKGIFKEASGDLLLSLCKLLEVSWQVMIDDKISGFVEKCKNFVESQSIAPPIIRRFFDEEKSNETKVPCEYINERGQSTNKQIDWFDVIPCLAIVPKSEVRNMASKLCIQLHSFPKDLFRTITATEIVTGLESQVLNKLELELRYLPLTLMQRSAKDSIRLCFFSEDDMLESNRIPNEASCNLGQAWMSVERLIAQLCSKEIYVKSLAEVQSWVDQSVARIFVPLDENDPKFDKASEVNDSSDGMPCWEESIEFLDMLQEALADDNFCPQNERNWFDDPNKSPYIIIKSRPDLPHGSKFDNGGTKFNWREMQVFSKKLDLLDKKDDDNAPAIREYSCYVCHKEGRGYCYCFQDDEKYEESAKMSRSLGMEPEIPDMFFVHPQCIYERAMAGPIHAFVKGNPPIIPQDIENRYKEIFESNKSDQDVTWANERKSFVVEQVKDSIAPDLFVDHLITEHDANSKSLQTKKVQQLKRAMMQIGIIDQLIEIAKIPFPRKYTFEEAETYNQKMQRRMDARRINYLFEKASATHQRVTIVENLVRRIFGLLAIAATNYLDIQNRLYDDIDFLFSKALEPTANDSALCIAKTIEGNLGLAQDVSIDLLSSMVDVAQDGQNPDDILLLKPFMSQGDKNVSINQREILELCLPTSFSHTDDCMFVLDSDYPSESVDKISYEMWKKKLEICHVPKPKMNFGENPWSKDQNWKHLLRVSSDIAHGGFASTSEPCRSAFHMAFIETLISCAFKNPEERQNVIVRLPIDQIFHIVNTVCRTLYHRIWGHSFLNRIKLVSGDPQFADISTVTFDRDPRLSFLNFDALLTTAQIHSKSSEMKNLEILPLLGVLKFVNVYMNLMFNVHFFSETAADDIVRRTTEGLPLTATADKTLGFIEWMGIILKGVLCVFSFKIHKNLSEEADPSREQRIAGVVSTPDSTARLSVPLQSSFSSVARPFKDIDEEWYRAYGDVSVTDFDSEISHHLISIVLNQMWSRIFGLEVSFESKTMQGLKMSDSIAFDSRMKDIYVSKKFCRPFWRCPMSHNHFTDESYSVLVLAISSILFDSVPIEWKSTNPKSFETEKKPSILGALRNNPMGYQGSTTPAFRPNPEDIAEAQLFVIAIELLIQEMHTDLTVKGTNCFISPWQVLATFTENFEDFSKMSSFKHRWIEFQSHLQDENQFTSWPRKLAQSSNKTAALVLIEKKITQWNIICLFNMPQTNASLHKGISTIQIPIVRRCLSWALVYNWGGWGGLGSEISLTTLTDIIDSIGSAFKDICQITLDTFPSFIQQLFQRFEAPKPASYEALEYKKVGDLFLRLATVLQTDQSSSISKYCAEARDTYSSSPLVYLKHVGTMLQNPPNTWSTIDAYTKPRVKIATVLELFQGNLSPITDESTKSLNATSSLANLHQDTAKQMLLDSKVEEIIRTTVESSEVGLMYRFLAIDTANRLNPVDSESLPFSFFSRRELKSSTNRSDFPPYLSKMVYNILNVLNSSHRMPRGEESNDFLHTCLRVIIEVVFAGACVDLDEGADQFAKLSKNKLVLDQHDSDSLFARVGHLQECIVGLHWLSEDEMDASKHKALQSSKQNLHTSILVTHPSYKMSLKTFQSIAKLITHASPTLEIRTQAMLALSGLLDHCSTAVLDRFFDPKDTQVVHSPSNSFARSMQQCFKAYEEFQDRDDDLTIYLQQFKTSTTFSDANVLQKSAGGRSDDEFVRKLIEFETTDWIREAINAREGKREPKLPHPIIQEAYVEFCSKGFTTCLYSLRLICQMCVQSGKMTRASYAPGQKYMIVQPNSDPALAVDFPSVLNSLGSAIASRMRLGQANVFDIRILCRLFKALNSITFGQSSSETQDFLVAETFVLINKTVSGLSQRIDDISAPFFPGNHPVHVLEQLLMYLLSFALSDIDGKSCQALSKGTSWINFFNLIAQVHSTAAKVSSVDSFGENRSSQISAAEYRSVACRICDSAYILYSAVKRRDISRSAQLEKDWNHAHLEAVAADAQRRVSCVEIVRTPGFAELCFFTNPDIGEVGDNTQTTLLCLEDSRQLSLRKNLVICELLRNRKLSSSGLVAHMFKFLRNLPLFLTALINLLLLGWLNLPIDYSQAKKGWKWPQKDFSWKFLVPNITSEDGAYSFDEFQNKLLPNVLPLFISDESSEGIMYRNGINMTFLILACLNILSCFVLVIGWLWRNSSVEVYESLLTSAYNEFLSPSNKSKKKISLEDLQMRASGSSFFMILRIPAFWGHLAMFVCSMCVLLISPLFSVLFVFDSFRFPGIFYIFGAFTAKGKEFATLAYLTATIIFINSVIGLVFFWDLFASGENESGSSECTSLFQCTLTLVVLGWQGGGLSDLLQSAKDTPQGTPYQIGSPKPESYRLVIALLWQLLYFIIVPTCLVSTVVGIISDSFGDARQKKSEWKDTMSQYCFVCGRTAADFRDAGLVAGLPPECIVSFEEHVTTEHCVKDYFKLFMGVKGFKNPDLLTAQEHYVLQKINSLDETFFPMDLSISLDAMKSFAESESSAAEKQEKRLDSIDQEIGKLSMIFDAQIKEVLQVLADVKRNQESMNPGL